MSEKDLQAKVAYFQQQDLLNQSDDEKDFPDSDFVAFQVLIAESKAMPPPIRHRSSFLGPTPRERLQEFNAHATRQRTAMRGQEPGLIRSSTVPEPATKSFPGTKSSQEHVQPHGKLKKTASMSDLSNQDNEPFYRRFGETPREKKHSKAKPDTNIKVEPEHKQLLKEKIVYFFPNNDISMARRRRIHKIIELGAAWVTTWRDDVTHVMFDQGDYTYSQLLRHLSRAGLPRRVVVVKFEPYIPQCIQRGALTDHTAGRFAVKGAPRPSEFQAPDLTDSQSSLKIKPSRRQLAAESSQNTDWNDTEGTTGQHQMDESPSSSEEIVKDSFIGATSSPKFYTATIPNIFGDDLSKAIEETRAVAHLPLDDEEEGDLPLTSSVEDSEPETDDEDATSGTRHINLSSKASIFEENNGINQHRFQCMNPAGASSTASNPNARTIEILEQMGKYYDQMQDQWRTLAYRRAVTTLRKQDIKITTAKQAAALPFVGPRLADKIEEIVLTDRLRRLDSMRNDPTDKVIRLFTGVYGAGLIQASKWLQAGHRTLEDLLAHAKLTDSQRIGIERYNDFATRVLRAEVQTHGEYVRKILNKIDPEFQVMVMGSYRRGAKDSGDIDLIITKPGATLSTLRDIVFEGLVPSLFKDGFLKAKLATSHIFEDGTKWHGASCLPSSTIWRRLDLLLVPEEEMGGALLYFTGNDIFNRSMRLLASKKGMRLNQKGLYKDVMRGKNGKMLSEGMLLEGKDERRIFEILGVPWREPSERIC